MATTLANASSRNRNPGGTTAVASPPAMTAGPSPVAPGARSDHVKKRVATSAPPKRAAPTRYGSAIDGSASTRGRAGLSVHPTATTVNPQLTIMTMARYASGLIH